MGDIGASHAQKTVGPHNLQTLRIPWDNERARPGPSRVVGIRNREKEEIVGDAPVSYESFLSVEDEISANASCSGLDGTGVRPCPEALSELARRFSRLKELNE